MSVPTKKILKQMKTDFSKLNSSPRSLAPSRANLDIFKIEILRKINYLLGRIRSTGIVPGMIRFYKDRFLEAFDWLTDYFDKAQDNGLNLYKDFYQKALYLDHLDNLLYLGVWDDSLTYDPDGVRSALGPLFLLIQKYKGDQPVGIVQAAEQQLVHPHRENLIKGQKLANDIYYQFLKFLEPNLEFNAPPLVQFFNRGGSTLLSGLVTPAFIMMDEKEGDTLSGFSALPHECGHVLAHTPQGANLLKDVLGILKAQKKTITRNIKSELRIKKFYHQELWATWLEECFADAIAIATIKEAEIFSLAHLFSDEPTNKIYENHEKTGIDEHPNRHIRVLLTIVVARKLNIGWEIGEHPVNKIPIQLLDKAMDEWEAIGRKLNTDYGDGKIMNLHENWYHSLDHFTDALDQIADIMVETCYKGEPGKNLINFVQHFEEYQRKRAKEIEIEIKKGNVDDTENLKGGKKILGEAEQLRDAVILDLLESPTSNIAKKTFNIYDTRLKI